MDRRAEVIALPTASVQSVIFFVVVAEIVMTTSKHGTTTSIRIEKVRKAEVDKTRVAHTAGGQHQGLVINKQQSAGQL